MRVLKQVVARLPHRWQTELKRIHYGRQIDRGTFATDEPDYNILDKLVAEGDWTIDVGANIGHYTKRFSDLVGPQGRVIAFEPVPTTFSLLSANVQRFTHPNVTLINAAVSDKSDVVGISIPNFSTGLMNYYEAHISPSADGMLSVLTVSLDSLSLNHRIALVKIDAEGHDAFVISGMRKLLERDRPVLVIETAEGEVINNLALIGYAYEKLYGSPNVLFKPRI